MVWTYPANFIQIGW